jgi:hypothetical protein
MNSSSKQSNAVGVAALVLGAWSVSRTAPELVGGVSTTAAGLGALAGTVGGLAAVGVGAGVLMGFGEFDTEDGSGRTVGLALTALAVCALAAGIQFAV